MSDNVKRERSSQGPSDQSGSSSNQPSDYQLAPVNASIEIRMEDGSSSDPNSSDPDSDGSTNMFDLDSPLGKYTCRIFSGAAYLRVSHILGCGIFPVVAYFLMLHIFGCRAFLGCRTFSGLAYFRVSHNSGCGIFTVVAYSRMLHIFGCRAFLSAAYFGLSDIFHE